MKRIKFERIIMTILLTASMLRCTNKMRRDEIEKDIRLKAAAINSSGNIEKIENLFSKDFVFHRTGQPDIKGLAAYEEYLHGSQQQFRFAFPDFRLQIEDIVIGDNRAAVLYAMTGTQTGSFMGHPASGKKMNMPLVYFYRFENGKFVESREIADGLTLMQQLGAIPAPKK